MQINDEEHQFTIKIDYSFVSSFLYHLRHPSLFKAAFFFGCIIDTPGQFVSSAEDG